MMDDLDDPFKSFSWQASPTTRQSRSRPEYKQHKIGRVGGQKVHYEPGFIDHIGKWRKTFEVGYYNHNGVWTPVEPQESFVKHPRVPITLETLEAYASMRGSVGKKREPIYCDRLHCALYQNPSRFVQQEPLLLTAPLFGKGDGEMCEMDELDPKSLWFWDPVSGPEPIPREIKQYPEICPKDASQPRPKPLHGGPVCNMSYKEWIKKYPVRTRTRDEIIEDAGWIKINGKWADPDDWEQTAAANMNLPEDCTDPSFPKYHPPILFDQTEPRNKREEEYFKFRKWLGNDDPDDDVYKYVGSYLYPGGLKRREKISEAEAQMFELHHANLAEMAKSRDARGYRYTDANIVAFADQYLNNPEGREYPPPAEGAWHGNLDASPEPLGKDHYISPATFARWAEGMGDNKLKYFGAVPSPDEPEFLPQEKLPPQDDDALFRPGTKEIYGICRQSEDYMSGTYSVESNPQMIHSPHGRLNVLKMPKNFQRSYPRHYDQFIKQGFRTQGDSPKYPNYSFGTASEAETFTKERIVNHFATDGVTKEKAQEKFHDTQAYLSYLRTENESHDQKRLINSFCVNHYRARKIFACHAVTIAKEGLRDYIYDIERQRVEMQNLVEDIPRESFVGLTRLAEADKIAEERSNKKLNKAEKLAQDFLVPERQAHLAAQAAKQACLEEVKPYPIAQKQYVGDTQSYPPNLAPRHVVDESGYFKMDHPTKKQYRRYLRDEVERSELEIARIESEGVHKDIQIAEYRYQIREAKARFCFLQVLIEDVQAELPEDQRDTHWKAKQEYLDAFEEWKPVDGGELEEE